MTTRNPHTDPAPGPTCAWPYAPRPARASHARPTPATGEDAADIAASYADGATHNAAADMAAYLLQRWTFKPMPRTVEERSRSTFDGRDIARIRDYFNATEGDYHAPTMYDPEGGRDCAPLLETRTPQLAAA